ncbi:hypothetical protein [Xylophilus sp. GOD-11R]|uniref:hypothetical protein n=1 Tax=Xylophilus sp. GOD-11R TaxID=3089814 RepID=UPI00298C47E9|nr:hypothetical protein [Xylophilus sp. GOD-11R]WPB59183.1 hypothetical protein R9X41_11275 [Xylophilus sp. GOD-11R]
MAHWKKQALDWAVLAALGLSLTACGGGGGSDDSTVMGNGDGIAGQRQATPPTPPTPTTPPTPEVPGTVQVQGIVRFESIPTKPTGGLDYAAQTAKPARYIRVDAIDVAGTVVAQGATDADGRYAMAVPPLRSIRVRMFASMVAPGSDSGQPSAEVADNTDKLALYTAITQPFTSGTSSAQHDIRIPSGWAPVDGGIELPSGRVAAPFAILDTIYTAQARVLASAPATVFPLLTVMWSKANTGSSSVSSIDVASGDIGGTQFLTVKGYPVMLLLGKAGVDTDEYDASVIAHEWGHYWQQSFSRDDSPGGTHEWGDLLDPTVAFSEGFATAWSGIALGRDSFVDSFGPQQKQGSATNLLAAPTDASRGWFREDSVQYLLRRLHDLHGPRVVLDAMAGPMRTSPANTGIHAFHQAVTAVSTSAAATLAPLLRTQAIEPNTDAWGIGETNGGGSTVALPMVQPLALGAAPTTACVSASFDPYRVGNRLGQIAYLRVAIPAAGTYRVTVDGPATTNPDFILRDTAGEVLRSFTTGSTTETAAAELKAGEHVIAVRDGNRSSSHACFQVSIQ